MASTGLEIAVLCPGYGLVSRGVETFIADLARRILARHQDWAFDIYTRAPAGIESPGIRRIHLPALDRDGRLAGLYAKVCHRVGVYLRTRIDAECLSFTLSLAPKLLPRRYDLVFNQAGPFAGRLLQLKRRMDGTPFVHKTASGQSRLELVMAGQRPDAVVATSQFVHHWLTERQPGRRVECIPNAVDCSVFRPYSPEEFASCRNGSKALRMSRPVVLYVGAMDPMKRPELIIYAVSRIPEAGLVMVGSGRLRETVREMGRNALGEDRFVLVPHVSRDRIALYYNACDVFTLPSEEPFGIVFLEAMACNKPVVAHESPVQRWIFRDAGLTCDCTNPDEYAATIRRTLATDFGTKPRERSRAFDWSEVAPAYERLFEDLACRGGDLPAQHPEGGGIPRPYSGRNAG